MLNNKLGYLSLDIIRSTELTVFLELRSQEAVRFLGYKMSPDKYPSTFSCQMEAIVYVFVVYIFIKGTAKTIAVDFLRVNILRGTKMSFLTNKG